MLKLWKSHGQIFERNDWEPWINSPLYAGACDNENSWMPPGKKSQGENREGKKSTMAGLLSIWVSADQSREKQSKTVTLGVTLLHYCSWWFIYTQDRLTGSHGFVFPSDLLFHGATLFCCVCPGQLLVLRAPRCARGRTALPTWPSIHCWIRGLLVVNGFLVVFALPSESRLIQEHWLVYSLSVIWIRGGHLICCTVCAAPNPKWVGVINA